MLRMFARSRAAPLSIVYRPKSSSQSVDTAIALPRIAAHLHHTAHLEIGIPDVELPDLFRLSTTPANDLRTLVILRVFTPGTHLDGSSGMTRAPHIQIPESFLKDCAPNLSLLRIFAHIFLKWTSCLFQENMTDLWIDDLHFPENADDFHYMISALGRMPCLRYLKLHSRLVEGGVEPEYEYQSTCQASLPMLADFSATGKAQDLYPLLSSLYVPQNTTTTITLLFSSLDTPAHDFHTLKEAVALHYAFRLSGDAARRPKLRLLEFTTSICWPWCYRVCLTSGSNPELSLEENTRIAQVLPYFEEPIEHFHLTIATSYFATWETQAFIPEEFYHRDPLVLALPFDFKSVEAVHLRGWPGPQIHNSWWAAMSRKLPNVHTFFLRHSRLGLDNLGSTFPHLQTLCLTRAYIDRAAYEPLVRGLEERFRTGRAVRHLKIKNTWISEDAIAELRQYVDQLERDEHL